MGLYIVKKSLKESIKDYLNELKPQVKNNWLTVGSIYVVMTIVFSVLFLIDALIFKFGLSSLVSMVMLLMYGSSNYWSVLLGMSAVIISLVLLIILEVFAFYIVVALQFGLQDVDQGAQLKVSFQDTWRRIKQMNKNQLLRLYAYNSLFIFLWLLPVMILQSLFGSNQIVVHCLQAAGFLILVRKSLDYSQAIFLYREYQPHFLGQSQRYALKASQRFMKGNKGNLLGQLVLAVIPLALWGAIWGAVTYFGFYIWEPIMIYGGPVIGVLGVCFYLPLFQLVLVKFYAQHKNQKLLETAFRKTFKPVAQLTGEAYKKR